MDYEPAYPFDAKIGKARQIISDPDDEARYDASHRLKEIAMLNHGGCLCGALRYATRANPLRVTICHCKFCQRATGSAYMVEPVFRLEHLRVTKGTPSVFQVRSRGSGKTVRVHFCATCGTKLYLTFERFPDSCGVYAAEVEFTRDHRHRLCGRMLVCSDL